VALVRRVGRHLVRRVGPHFVRLGRRAASAEHERQDHCQQHDELGRADPDQDRPRDAADQATDRSHRGAETRGQPLERSHEGGQAAARGRAA
jgi:hypothetical protein